MCYVKKNQCVVEICWPMWIRSLTPLSYHQWGRLAAYHICRVLTAYLLSHQRGPTHSLISLAIGDSVY
jgi:hypothetical protein